MMEVLAGPGLKVLKILLAQVECTVQYIFLMEEYGFVVMMERLVIHLILELPGAFRHKE